MKIKMTQRKAIEKHLNKYGNINIWEAIELYGATHLSGIIYVLRKDGWNISSEKVKIKNRYGNPTTIVIYIKH